MTAPFQMPEPMELTLDLPFPPSANKLWRRGKRAGMYLDPKYRAWIREADAHVTLAKAKRGHNTIAGPCEAHISLSVDGGIGDLDNRIKSLLDYSQRIQLIENDKLIMKITAEWVKASAAPYGCRLVLRELAG